MLQEQTEQGGAVSFEARLSFTGSGDVLLHVPGDQLILGADPYADPPNSATLDRIAEELTANGRFGDLGEAILWHDDETETVPVRVTFEMMR